MINTCTRGEGEIGDFFFREKIKAHLYCFSDNGVSVGNSLTHSRGGTYLREHSEYMTNHMLLQGKNSITFISISAASNTTLLTHKELNKCFLASNIPLHHSLKYSETSVLKIDA